MTDHKWEPLVNKLCYLPAQLMATYFLMYYQIPKLIYKKKYIAFILSFAFSIYITSVVARFFKIYVYEPILYPGMTQEPIIEILTEPAPIMSRYVVWVYLSAIFAVIVKLIKEHFEEKQQMELLRKDKATAELGFLKAQLHPHFLFNTLNNLYTLTLIKSPEAPVMIQKLADMVDYTLYQERDREIPISKEIELIQNYIDLELLRYGHRLDLQFHKNIQDPARKIAPLILLSMIENAFKHGASGDHECPKIYIDLIVDEKEIYCSVFNSKPIASQKDKSGYKKGIGLKNIKKQLALLYPTRYSLKIDEKERTYEIGLSILC